MFIFLHHMGLEHSKLRRSKPEPEQEDRVEPAPPSDVSHNLAAGADEKPFSCSLAAHRERVQQLRAQQAPELSSDAPVREELQRAGVLDQPDTQAQDSSSSADSDNEADDSDSTEEVGPVLGKHVLDETEEPGMDDSAPPRTRHEIEEDDIPVPSISQVDTQDMPKLERIGHIHSVVDNVVLIEQDNNAQESDSVYDVLDSESLLCMEDGRVLGLVYETFGSVLKPMYTVRFRSNADIDHEMVAIGRSVYFLPSNSTYVLTRSIRTKGSDASNMWDEEVAEDEVEYSDDEEEQEAKRRNKKSRSSRWQDDSDPATASLGPLGASRGQKRRGPKRPQSMPYPSMPQLGWPLPPRPWYPPSDTSSSAVPHFNPRFAEQWLFPRSSTRSYGIPTSLMSPYSPYEPGMSHETYDPNAPGPDYTRPQ